MQEFQNLSAAIRHLGLAGQNVCVHASLRAFTMPLPGGAEGLLQAFLKEGCTVMAVTHTYMYEVSPPADTVLLQNGMEEISPNPPGEGLPPFNPVENALSQEYMGAFPAALLAQPGRVRGNNALNSISALGPNARGLIEGQSPANVFAPLAALCETGGYVLPAGVDLTKCTLIHYAEQLAGRRPFIRWAKDPAGRPAPCQIGSCSDGFNHFAETLRPIETAITVNGSPWRCYPAAGLAARCAAAMQARPEITQCADESCIRCRDSVLGGPL